MACNIGDINIVVSQLNIALSGWHFDTASPYMLSLKASARANEARAAKTAKADTVPINYDRTFAIIKQTLQNLSPPEDGSIFFVSEGANTMDISRSIFAVEHHRLRLDAGTNATMGIGLGYAIAAYTHYNPPPTRACSGSSSSAAASKKIVCIEGDSAFGFSMSEVETMARYGMEILSFVINNGGIYHGDSDSSAEWLGLQKKSRAGHAVDGLRSTSLGWEVGYEKMPKMCGAVGYSVETPEELQKATEEGFKAKVPVVINITIEAGQATKLVK